MNVIDRLAGFVPEPYQKEQVLAAAKAAGGPFLLREVIGATGLPKSVCHRVLSRLVRDGQLRRYKIPMSYPRFDRSSWSMLPGGRQRRVYLYSFRESGQ